VFGKEPYSKRDAWCWLIETACFRDTRANINGRVIPLRRGQLSFSVRFLALKWGWDKMKVERFLRRLKSEAMIETQTETGQNIITICNYDKYQLTPNHVETQTDTEVGTQTGQERDSRETKKNTLNTEKEYAFLGKVIRLRANDFESWKKSFFAIPDLTAELTALDAYYAEKGVAQNDWFHRACTALKNKHQKSLPPPKQRHNIQV
jgi:hypothetical protein